MKKRGFTLMELMVVVGVIALLLTALLPAVMDGLAQARNAACISKLKDWGGIWSSYTKDHDGSFNSLSSKGSTDNVWISALRGYYQKDNEMLQCPVTAKGQLGSRGMWTHSITGNLRIEGSYTINGWISNASFDAANHWKSTKDVAHPIQIPVMIDGCSVEAWPEHTAAPSSGDGSGSNMDAICIDRHERDGKQHVNCLRMDWSVKSVVLKDLWTLKWHRGFTPSPLGTIPKWME